MATCTECGQLLSFDGPVTADQVEEHRLWRHPTDTDVAVVIHEIDALGQQVQVAYDARDWLSTYLLLEDLHDKVTRAKAYMHARADEGIAA
ncbi:hypothetical protein [Nocardia otitidiscaviarum]|uniref:hypothetical protein n=1 Tax=Nocardia otitidiscaviarum TaxID=1823 RepID=UPI000A764756|nr:hypothetical protein [Nocardia otitidiscaviarum]